jgi:hypothetical protein
VLKLDKLSTPVLVTVNALPELNDSEPVLVKESALPLSTLTLEPLPNVNALNALSDRVPLVKLSVAELNDSVLEALRDIVPLLVMPNEPALVNESVSAELKLTSVPLVTLSDEPLPSVREDAPSILNVEPDDNDSAPPLVTPSTAPLKLNAFVDTRLALAEVTAREVALVNVSATPELRLTEPDELVKSNAPTLPIVIVSPLSTVFVPELNDKLLLLVKPTAAELKDKALDADKVTLVLDKLRPLALVRDMMPPELSVSEPEELVSVKLLPDPIDKEPLLDIVPVLSASVELDKLKLAVENVIVSPCR